jgi:membrane protein YqaA with SNARE-associated domain
VKTILGTLGFSLLGSLIPIFNVEVYLVALATQIPKAAVIPLAIAAGAGQTAGKIAWYHLSARSMDLPFVQRRMERPKFKAQFERWERVINGHALAGAGITFASGLIGFPPLLVIGAVGGAIRMNQAVFISMIFLGRTLQSWAILIGLTSIFELTSLFH